ncbi:MAG TPA: hypothetical protein VJN18_27010 [Polyangiaceae bacterium]|nr:hypothetical protein [Polyangiaceae bacterium]
MRTQRTAPRTSSTSWCLALLATFGCFLACGQTHDSGSGETHFLVDCEKRSCVVGLECLCGVCTRRCDDNARCADLASDATCVQSLSVACSAWSATCDVECGDDDDCARPADRIPAFTTRASRSRRHFARMPRAAA